MKLLIRLCPVILAAHAFAQGGITVYHQTAKVTRGTTRQFTAYVPISPNTVEWLVNGVVGGGPTYGTVTQTGLYTAPAVIPADNVVNVTARSTAYPNIQGSAVVTICQPQPWIWSINPSTPGTGAPVTLTLNGSAYMAGSVVLVNNVPWTTTFVSATSLRATGVFPSPGAYAVTVVQPAPGAIASSPMTLNATGAAPPPPPPVSVTVSPTSASVALSATQQFTANVAVTWTATAGAINSAGLYTAPAAMPPSGTATIQAVSTADPTKSAQATVTLTAAPANPPPSSALLSAARLLEQATYGPTPQALVDVQAQGAPAWIDAQLNLPETAIALPATLTIARAQFLNRVSAAPDQLRQRMIHALGQIVVISTNKNVYPDEYIPYVRILSRNAFGNYRTLLKEITVSPQMGKYLDLANSNKPGLGSGANENFPRELLQLFSIGLVLLNPDGSPKTDGAGQPIPAYTQNDIRQFALALTGWTYPTAPGAQPQANNWENFSQPAMESRPANHDTNAKTLLNGVVLPAGQTVEQDTDAVIDCVFQHPNTPPFVALRLIRALVTSNPSPAYVQRIAQVFANNGTGVRGDLRATVRAILLDPEARQDQAAPHQGRLKDPLQLYVSFVRNMGSSISASTQIAYIFDRLGQSILNPPSVFGYYSPLYRLPGNATLFGPEFQIYTPTESMVLGNEIYQMINGNSDPAVSLAAFEAAAVQGLNPLLDLINARFFYGRLPVAMRQSLANAIQPGYDARQRAQTAVYLSVLSGLYAVQY